MGLEFSFGQMDQNTRDFGLKIKLMEKENLLIQMEMNLRVKIKRRVV